MNKKPIIFYIVCGIIITIAIIIFFSPKSTNKNLTLFTRSDCPHCKIVEQFIADNKIKEKINFTDKEIHDEQNAADLVKAAGQCGINQDQVGVPLLFDGTQCYIGDQNIINYFAARIK